MVRAVLLLYRESGSDRVSRRALRLRRTDLTEAARGAVAAALEDVAKVLEEYGGDRLSGGNLDALGGLRV
jgi:hypothetical protein